MQKKAATAKAIAVILKNRLLKTSGAFCPGLIKTSRLYSRFSSREHFPKHPTPQTGTSVGITVNIRRDIIGQTAADPILAAATTNFSVLQVHLCRPVLPPLLVPPPRGKNYEQTVHHHWQLRPLRHPSNLAALPTWSGQKL
jgi:hypothetical protein